MCGLGMRSYSWREWLRQDQLLSWFVHSSAMHVYGVRSMTILSMHSIPPYIVMVVVVVVCRFQRFGLCSAISQHRCAQRRGSGCCTYGVRPITPPAFLRWCSRFSCTSKLLELDTVCTSFTDVLSLGHRSTGWSGRGERVVRLRRNRV